MRRHAEVQQLAQFETVVLVRTDDEEDRYLVILNFGEGTYGIPLHGTGVVVLDTSMQRRGEECLDCVEVHPDEGLIVRLID